MPESNKRGMLYLVATPIGNLGDISQRAIDVFQEADFIAAEDTRVTVKLLNHFNIKKPLVSYYEHNQIESGSKILSRIIAGETCALVSDAGTPAISDPGSGLAGLCWENGISVVAIPGPCAAISALILSALPTGRFTFEGFLSTVKKRRFEHLAELKNEKRTMIFYEAPHKLRQTLKDMSSAFGEDRKISISRELTKIHEETIHTTIAGAIEHFSQTSPRGEFVLVINGLEEESAPQPLSPQECIPTVFKYIDEGMSLRDAVKKCSFEMGVSKKELYDLAVKENNKTN